MCYWLELPWVKAIAAKLNDLSYIPRTQMCHPMHLTSLALTLSPTFLVHLLYLQKKQDIEIVVFRITRPDKVLTPSHDPLLFEIFPHILKDRCLQPFVVIGSHLFAKVGELLPNVLYDMKNIRLWSCILGTYWHTSVLRCDGCC